MRLKKLVIDGFKSFGKKTEFVFEPGITCIVGPNGCGKSNVVDAFRWVLGITSAKAVRGAEMTDLIFDGGARTRAAQYAQVTLTFDNRDRFFARVDRDEVEISRKLARDGKSQYILNGEPCRLKDFKLLFQDTGIGVEAYSIIEQGKVDLLLSTDASERRKIFEEAAGINRYKGQRHEAELRLGRTEQNLARLTDIIEEVRGQMRRVKAQATKAERWKEYTAEQTALKTQRSLREYRHLHEQRDGWLVQATRAQRELDGHEEILDAEREKMKEAQARYDELQSEMDQIRQSLHEAERGISGHEASLEANRKRLQEIDDRRRRMRQAKLLAESQKENFVKRREKTALLVEELERDQAGREQALEILTGREADLQAEIDVHEGAARQRRERLDELQRRHNALHTSISQLEADIRIAATDLEKLDRLAAETVTRVANLKGKLADLEAHREEATTRHATSQQELADAEAELATIAERINELAGSRERVGSELARVESRRATLQEVLSGTEGLAPGTRELLEDNALRKRFGVKGLVSELIDTPDDVAGVVEAVLGPLADAVVVDRTANAFAALDHLDRHGAGGAQLVAAEALKGIAPAELELNGHSDKATLLSEVCKAGKAATPVLNALLGTTVLVDDLGMAGEVLDKLPAEVGVATRNREVLRRPAWFAGRPETGGRLSGQGELATLEERVAELTREQKTVADGIAEQEQRRERLTARTKDLQAQATEARITLGDVESELRHTTRELESAEQQQQTMTGDRESADEARELGQDRLAEAREEFSRVERELASLSDESDSGGSELVVLQQQRQTLAAEVADARVLLAELGQRLVSQQEGLKLIEEGINNHEADLQRLEEDSQQLETDEAESKESVENSRKELDRLKLAANQHRNAQQSRERELAGAKQAVTTGRVRLDDVLSRCEATRAALAEARHREEACSERMSDLRTRALEELEVDLDEMLIELQGKGESAPAGDEVEDVDEAEDADTADASGDDADASGESGAAPTFDLRAIAAMSDEEIHVRIEELAEKIRRLGPVNLAALEELEELTQKHEFLSKEEADLVSARNAIRKLVSDIDTRTRQMFSETFEHIRHNFQRIFRKLFNGGAADVYLTDPEDVLTSGIEIKARPPGSEPRTLTLLSGGQRSMIAIAMLFAIFETRPSPFCILDEVDAALDDANTGRIGALLQEFTDRSQFLVITHSKATMAVADLLYGITMQEQGVSKRVHIRFEQVHETEDGELDFDEDEPAAADVA